MRPFLLIFICAFGIACSSKDESSILSEGLVFCSEGNPDTLNPQFATSGVSLDASAHTLFNRLVEFKPGTTEIEPGLARSWEISENGLRYRFYLREGVSFHETEYFTPTRYFNADDVIFSFNRQRLSSHPYHYVSNRKFPYFQSLGMGELIRDIRRIDELTVEFVLTRPEAPFLSTLALEFASILSAEYAEFLLLNDMPENFDLMPIGTGPFVFRRHVQDAYIRFQRHQRYFRGPEAIRYLVFAITPRPSVRYARLIAGECDVMANPLPLYLDKLAKNTQFLIQSTAGLNVGYWAFNTRKAPFNQRNVRLALNHAIDRKSIVKAVFAGSAQIADSPVPPSIWGHHAELESFSYNPQLAKFLLDEAGVKGLSLEIWISPIQRAYNPDTRKTAEMMARDLAAIGIRTRIVSYEWSAFLNKLSRGEHDTALLGWLGDNSDPDNFLTPLLSCEAAQSGSNRAFWCHAEFDRLIRQARRTTDQDERLVMYRQAQALFQQEAPWMTLAHANQYLISRSYVKNLIQSRTGGVDFSGVYIERTQ